MEEKERLEILEKTAPGTPLRQAIDLVVQLGKGGLIVVAEREVISPLVVAGFELNTPFTPQAVAELSMMDRAVVVDPGLRTILYANAHLAPDPSIPSFETGTRHRAAEQTARQLGCPVIAISEERRRTTIYLGDWKHELQDPMTLLSQASQALLILDRYRAELNELLTELGPLEFERRVFPYHVALIIQKIVQMLELEEELKRIFLELGTYRELPQRQLRGLMRGVREELELIVLDFQKDQERPVEEVIQGILKMSVEDRLSPEAVLKHLGFDEDDLEKPLSSRGYRLLHKIPRLPMPVIERLVREFGSVDQIERQGRRQLQRIKGVAEVRARAIKAGLRRFKAGYATGLEGF